MVKSLVFVLINWRDKFHILLQNYGNTHLNNLISWQSRLSSMRINVTSHQYRQIGSLLKFTHTHFSFHKVVSQSVLSRDSMTWEVCSTLLHMIYVLGNHFHEPWTSGILMQESITWALNSPWIRWESPLSLYCETNNVFVTTFLKMAVLAHPLYTDAGFHQMHFTVNQMGITSLYCETNTVFVNTFVNMTVLAYLLYTHAGVHQMSFTVNQMGITSFYCESNNVFVTTFCKHDCPCTSLYMFESYMRVFYAEMWTVVHVVTILCYRYARTVMFTKGVKKTLLDTQFKEAIPRQ